MDKPVFDDLQVYGTTGCSDHLQRMLGYSIYGPFMGFVDGMHPKRVLER